MSKPGRIEARLDVCQGYANCVVNAPDFFDLSNEGVVTIQYTEVPASELRRVDAAARSCPVGALRVITDD